MSNILKYLARGIFLRQIALGYTIESVRHVLKQQTLDHVYWKLGGPIELKGT